MVVAEFKFCNQTISHPVSGLITVKEMISVVKQKWPYVPEDLILFSYTLRTCVDSISSSSAPDPASSSLSSCISIDEVVQLEDVTDDACLIKKVPKKSDAWVNILTGVGQLFEGGIKEVKDYVTKRKIVAGGFTPLSSPTKGVFRCKRYIGEHSCSLASSDPSKVRMRKSFLKDILADDLRASKKKKTASDVIDLLRMEYGVDLTYSQAYHGLQFTKQFFWGDDIKSYSDFVWYKDAIKHYNPGSVVNFEASITGFNNYCRPMLFIDCTFLTGKFKGGLMVACGKTGNQGGIIREDRPLTIISDRGNGLLKHVSVVFPKAFHSYCLYHMKGNIPIPKGKSKQTAVKLFEECYTALTKENFYAAAKSMSNLKLDSVVAWMMKIPFENWAAHAFLG
ncbi:uncharacterized protein LOC113296279 [Papaver somniferum]|uniref:uncharacterized protein LOC113296279 n=1 Tax=Papaver somniferum TaxID=3469 RepID=UPI000E6F96FE|nr:uncharacterized protein LOC113296279 [Papaver somniferum]